MKREVVQDFLNLPGIAGLALMDGRSRPYFCGIDRTLNFQQKEAIAQGIQQVINTTPADFEFFEFQFTTHRVYIYKLKHGIILLVLTVDSLAYAAHAAAVERLKLELQNDVANAIATFRLLAGSNTLSGQNYWKQGTDTTSTVTSSSSSAATSSRSHSDPPASPSLLTASDIATNPNSNNGLRPPSPPPLSLPNPPASNPVDSFPQPLPADQALALKEVLLAMNHLSQYATQYLGPIVVANYWKTTRPQVDWLDHFQVERSAQIHCSEQALFLTDAQHQWIRDWVMAFIDRCSKVIRDFPKTVKHTVLNDRQKFLLLFDSH